ncbi:MAG: hypothetical protein ABIS67_06995 [Candidatus Eisenbacteria bacterium]
MNDTTTMMTTDLDRLAVRVEKAAALVQQLREDRVRLEREREALAGKVQELEHKLQGQDPQALVQELGTIKREQKDWSIERKDIAARVETLIKKLEKLEG